MGPRKLREAGAESSYFAWNRRFDLAPADVT
jgi:hypothetical protein